ncbi:aminomethyltransferas-like protein [Xylona heveae TC161]|uniref:Aminomethyltransferase n=1 Tax=Xylona heveae (strain CBS 132557 / TC161) TaxID=1328760 RepID=A0A165JJK8_XYLHT|nr:aminomethyltransferas-like protein [Xylona heveae TC161]KZF26318.1 aminomethyltransferas-like protein [Xylona heveae TC161]
MRNNRAIISAGKSLTRWKYAAASAPLHLTVARQCSGKTQHRMLRIAHPFCRPADGRTFLQPSFSLRHASTSSESNLRKTPLYDVHVSHGGKMVPFAGYHMPVQYNDLGVGESHKWTREKASLFDVGHMVQHRFSGPGAEALLMKLTPGSISSLPTHNSTLSCFLHPGTGGIVDDTIVTRLGPELFYVVTNAACREKDLAYLSDHIESWTKEGGKAVDWQVLEDWGLVALQGPLSAAALGKIVPDSDAADLKSLLFGQSRFVQLRLPSGELSPPVHVARGGYTGEDGFEISLPPEVAVSAVESLLEAAGSDTLRWAGLGARDSLRLEAGMCLYGHDLDDTTTPVEAALAWTVGKDRRANGGFYGDEVILNQIKPLKDGGSGVTRRRIGLVVEGAPAREGAVIIDAEGNEVGKITSGCPSPTLKQNIAMGYIKNGLHKSGTEVQVVVRGKPRKAKVSKMPFVPTKYWKGITPA